MKLRRKMVFGNAFCAMWMVSEGCELPFSLLFRIGKGWCVNGSSMIPRQVPTVFESDRTCLMCRIHLTSRAGALHISTVQPWVGRLRTTPSLIWRHTGSAEEAFFLLFAIRVANFQFPCCGGRGIGVERKSGRTLMMRPLWFCCGSRDNRIRTDDLFNVTEAL